VRQESIREIQTRSPPVAFIPLVTLPPPAWAATKD